MFEKLKEAFASLTRIVSEKTLSARELDEALFSFQLSLLESDVGQDVVDSITDTAKKELLDTKVERAKETESVIREKLRNAILNVFSSAPPVDIIARAHEKKKTGEPFVVLFLGINGTGKTTTVAKFTSLLKGKGLSVVVAAGDTHRAGAIEQLTEHANRTATKVIAQRYGADPAAVARDAVLYAKAHHIDVVIIDTAGRMQTNQNLMEEMSKIVRVVNPDMKIFVADSLTGNDAISQAQLFSKYTGFDGAILTKADADTKGGAALSIAYTTGKPILYLGVGQDYGDIKPFDPGAFADSLVRD